MDFCFPGLLAVWCELGVGMVSVRFENGSIRCEYGFIECENGHTLVCY